MTASAASSSKSTPEAAAQRARRREQMPLTAEVVDAFRAVFGELAGIAADENGESVRWRK